MRRLRKRDLSRFVQDREAIEAWLRAEVVPVWDVLKVDPSRG